MGQLSVRCLLDVRSLSALRNRSILETCSRNNVCWFSISREKDGFDFGPEIRPEAEVEALLHLNERMLKRINSSYYLEIKDYGRNHSFHLVFVLKVKFISKQRDKGLSLRTTEMSMHSFISSPTITEPLLSSLFPLNSFRVEQSVGKGSQKRANTTQNKKNRITEFL